MIERIYLDEAGNTLPYGNLAREACLLEAVGVGECILYLWQNQRTVVIGRNQNAWKECRIEQLEADGGHLVRRLSGGGAVYHDLGNLNFTFLVREEDYDVSRQLEVLVGAVNRLGIHAEKTGRNDVTVDGRKISGNAFYRADGHCYHHGTILIDVDKASLSAYLNVSAAKLRSKGVDSVKARVANLTGAAGTGRGVWGGLWAVPGAIPRGTARPGGAFPTGGDLPLVGLAVRTKNPIYQRAFGTV